MADLSTTVGSLELRSPVVAASGTFGYGVEYDGLVDWALVGAISVKGLSRHPSQGNDAPRMVETAAGMLNAIGLQNIGVEAFAADKLPALRTIREQGPRVVVNCWGDVPEDYEAVVTALDGLDGIDAIELNLACPNKAQWDCIPSADPAMTADIVGRARARTGLPLWVKLTPNVTDVTVVARAAVDAGADALSLVNTLRGMAVDVEARRPVLGNTSGGLSGPAIKPVGLFMVHETCRTVEVPVVGGGGAVSGRDVVEYLMTGARAVQVGTASLYDPAAPSRIAREVSDVLDELDEASVQAVIGSLRTD